MTWFSVRRPALLLFALFLAACGGGSSGDLDADSQLALEIGVVSALASPSAMFPVSASDALMQRVQKVEGIQREVSTFGMIRAGRLISDEGGKALTSTISGPVNASVEVRNGEIGLEQGEIFVGEGTLLINAEGARFSFTNGKWRREARRIPDPTKIVLVELNEDWTRRFGLSNEDISRLAIEIYDVYSQHLESGDVDDALFRKLENFPINASSDHGVVRLRDIALIRGDLDDDGAYDADHVLLFKQGDAIIAF